MLLPILLMPAGSLGIALPPPYEQGGWFARLCLLLARSAEGMSLGGEVSNASPYLAGIAPPARRGRYSAFFYISTGTALLAASLLGVLLTNLLDQQQLESYGWRIAFRVGGVVGFVGPVPARWLLGRGKIRVKPRKARGSRH